MCYLPNSTIQHSQIKKGEEGECDSSSFFPNLFISPQNLGVFLFFFFFLCLLSQQVTFSRIMFHISKGKKKS